MSADQSHHFDKPDTTLALPVDDAVDSPNETPGDPDPDPDRGVFEDAWQAMAHWLAGFSAKETEGLGAEENTADASSEPVGTEGKDALGAA